METKCSIFKQFNKRATDWFLYDCKEILIFYDTLVDNWILLLARDYPFTVFNTFYNDIFIQN